MKKTSKLFYEAKGGLEKLESLKDGFVNILYNGLVCGNNNIDESPQFCFVTPSDKIDQTNLDEFITQTMLGEVDFEKSINQKVYELAYLLDERENQLKKQYNENV